MSSLDPSQYLRVLRVRQAYLFDLGGFLMRAYCYMGTLGVITMLTLSGWSYFMAGTVASVLAVAIFLVTPQVSRLIDQQGQRKIVPVATLIVMVGLALLIGAVRLDGPWQLCYVGAALMGFVPNPNALVRARWTYLLETGKIGPDAPELKAVYTYEGVVDDAAYMIGPSACIALAALTFPTAGMIIGGVAYVLGVVLMMASRGTEPQVGWVPADGEGKEELAKSANSKRSMFLESSMVRVLFAIMLFQGMVYGVYDSALVAFGQEQNATGVVSLIIASTSVGSIIAGLVFGMLKLKSPMSKQLLTVCVIFGVMYSLLYFANDMLTLGVVCFVASFSYAPLLIMLNTCCERSVPGARLTESLTWMSAGLTLGMTVAPTIGGIFVDNWGALAGLDFSSLCAILLIVFALATYPITRKHLG